MGPFSTCLEIEKCKKTLKSSKYLPLKLPTPPIEIEYECRTFKGK